MPDIEDVFDTLATTLDQVGVERAPLFLAKAALALAQALNDPERARAIIEAAARPDPAHQG
ncbi:hypothetical protein [Pararhodobacter zhoushanensis]|uniref:DUF2783 domain-containing protein n=1 Tax=Pararhodobacter zhoushanensis TaxID=2479545 RepID=A0ABT3GTP3_9RHOB|nr:hypothetical protein [Pararhodobacter zhoushanensis]MCW1930914.1 hypothetical protein [Pararhodobacter zhoushanensis]